MTVRSHAQFVLHELSNYLGSSLPPLLERVIEDVQKIDQQRLILQETLATAPYRGVSLGKRRMSAFVSRDGVSGVTQGPDKS
jgi:hypothetical protein